MGGYSQLPKKPPSLSSCPTWMLSSQLKQSNYEVIYHASACIKGFILLVLPHHPHVSCLAAQFISQIHHQKGDNLRIMYVTDNIVAKQLGLNYGMQATTASALQSSGNTGK